MDTCEWVVITMHYEDSYCLLQGWYLMPVGVPLPTWSGTGHWQSHCLAPGEVGEGAGYWGAVINSSAELFSFLRHFSWLCCRYKTNGSWQLPPTSHGIEWNQAQNHQNYTWCILNTTAPIEILFEMWMCSVVVNSQSDIWWLSKA